MSDAEGVGAVPEPAFLALVGPTASGKTLLSLILARALGGEVISMDSRQVYRGMDVGTGKVGLRERAMVPHHGLDLRDPSDRYSAGQFARDARDWIRGIRDRGRVPLLVGGTGFFLKALLEPMFPEPALEEGRRAALRDYLGALPAETLRRWVEVLDPARAVVARQGGRHRMIRTIEVALLTGRRLSWWHRLTPSGIELLTGMVVLLQVAREVLIRRIHERVEGMLAGGWVEEVELLSAAGYESQDPGMTAAGYQEVLEYVRGGISFAEARSRIQRAHRAYARRQVTWFRHQLPADTLVVDGTTPPDEAAKIVLAAWKKKGGIGLL